MKKGVKSKSEKKNVKNVVSIILGCVSIAVAFFMPYIVAVTGVLGIIFAYVEKGKGHMKSNRWALILNLLGIFLAIVVLMFSLFAVISLYTNGNQLPSY